MNVHVPVNSTYHEVAHGAHHAKWLETKSKRYNEYRRKWTENPANFINEGFPLNLDIEASSACNLLCPMCSRTIDMNVPGGGKRASKHFDYSLYTRLIDEAAEMGVYALKLNWLASLL